jgi:cephalosporin hydroxylase
MGAGIISNETEAGFDVAGIRFEVVTSNYHQHKTTKDKVVVLKGAEMLRSYDAIFQRAPKKTLFEIGVFEGGSTIYFALANPGLKIVGLDIRKPDEAVLRHLHDLGLADRVKIHYETSQSDPDAISRILRDDFGADEVGIVIDDASHNYHLSKKTFELTFGNVAAGGFYCLEDWAWAHWSGPFQTEQWIDQPALTNLVFEMSMLLPSARPLIEDIRITPGVVQVLRGNRKTGPFSIDKLLKMRGKNLAFI